MPNKEFIDYVKKLTVGEFITLVVGNKSNNDNNSIVYTTEEVLKNYPMFSRFTLNNAIKEQNLPYYRQGHKMYFKKELIDKWIKEHTNTYIKKNSNKYRL